MSAPSIRRRQDIRVPQAGGRSRPAFTIEPEIFLFQDRLEKLALPFRKNKVCRLRKAPLFGAVVIGVWPLLAPALFVCARRTKSGFESLEGAHSAGHALAVADTTLATRLDL